MAHHKRRRPKSARAGCLHCKPHKRNGANLRLRVRKSDLRRLDSADEQVREGANRSESDCSDEDLH